MFDRKSALATVRKRTAEIADSGRPLHEALADLLRVIEEVTPSGMIGSILTLDAEGRHLLHGAGPSLPEAYSRAIHGIAIGPEVGSCGTAAYHGRTVSVFDIANDPLWADFKDLALSYGLRACWSTPIHGLDGKILGTFANYYKVVRDPSPLDQDLTSHVTSTAASLIEQARSAGARQPSDAATPAF